MLHKKHDIGEQMGLCWAILILAFTIIFLGSLIARRAHGAELDIGLNYLSGQHETQSLNLGLKVPFLNEKALFSSKIRYGSHDNEIVQNQGHLRLNYDPKINKKWSLWFFEEMGYDKPKEIDFESFTGGGPKYILYRSDKAKASASVGYLYHYQDTKQANRLSLRLKGKSRLDLFDIYAVAFYQPNIEDFEDYLADAEIGVSIAIVEDLRLKLSIEDHYRSMLDEKNEFLTGLHLVMKF